MHFIYIQGNGHFFGMRSLTIHVLEDLKESIFGYDNSKGACALLMEYKATCSISSQAPKRAYLCSFNSLEILFGLGDKRQMAPLWPEEGAHAPQTRCRYRYVLMLHLGSDIIPILQVRSTN